MNKEQIKIETRSAFWWYGHPIESSLGLAEAYCCSGCKTPGLNDVGAAHVSHNACMHWESGTMIIYALHSALFAPYTVSRSHPSHTNTRTHTSNFTYSAVDVASICPASSRITFQLDGWRSGRKKSTDSTNHRKQKIKSKYFVRSCALLLLFCLRLVDMSPCECTRVSRLRWWCSCTLYW